MSELHDKQGGKVLEFDLIRPHDEARLRCSNCGNVARHVWPSKTPMIALECVCGRVGTLNYDLPEGPACGHDPKVYQWHRMTADGALTNESFCARCELDRLWKLEADQQETQLQALGMLAKSGGDLKRVEAELQLAHAGWAAERRQLHEIIAECNALIDPEPNQDLSDRIYAVLSPCDEGAGCGDEASGSTDKLGLNDHCEQEKNSTASERREAGCVSVSPREPKT